MKDNFDIPPFYSEIAVRRFPSLLDCLLDFLAIRGIENSRQSLVLSSVGGRIKSQYIGLSCGGSGLQRNEEESKILIKIQQKESREARK